MINSHRVFTQISVLFHLVFCFKCSKCSIEICFEKNSKGEKFMRNEKKTEREKEILTNYLKKLVISRKFKISGKFETKEQLLAAMINTSMENYPEFLKKACEKTRNKTLGNFEKRVAALIELMPEILYVQDEHLKTVGMTAALCGFEKIVLSAVSNEKALRLTDKFNLNTGMYAACAGMEKATMVALDDEIASTQQNVSGMNIGMFAASRKLKTATKKALENKNACSQKDKNNRTIAIHAARMGMLSLTKNLCNDEFASNEMDSSGKTLNRYVQDCEEIIRRCEGCLDTPIVVEMKERVF